MRRTSRGIRNTAIIMCLVALNLSVLSSVRAEGKEPEVVYVDVPVIVREAPAEVPMVDHTREVTDAEYELLKRVCMSEAGKEPLAGKIAVVETILNRVDLGYGSIEEVIYAPNQDSVAYNGEPNSECEQAVNAALKNGDMYDNNMIYFRTGHYHNFGTPYMQLGNHYFSLKG